MLQWRQTHEANIRADAILRSSAVIKGRVSEHLAPYISFPYNPRDARFIGSPIDIIVFNGAEEGYIREVVFLEVKTGDAAALSPKQRQIRDLIRTRTSFGVSSESEICLRYMKWIFNPLMIVGAVTGLMMWHGCELLQEATLATPPYAVFCNSTSRFS